MHTTIKDFNLKCSFGYNAFCIIGAISYHAIITGFCHTVAVSSDDQIWDLKCIRLVFEMLLWLDMRIAVFCSEVVSVWDKIGGKYFVSHIIG